MGLDMYLYRMPRYKDATAEDVSAIENYLSWEFDKQNPKSEARNYTLKGWCGIDESDLPPSEYIEFYRSFFKKRYSSWDVEKKYGHYSVIEMAGYWRKANQIHNWFVENIQDGIDDCEYHREVTKEDLKELYDICHEIICNSALVPSKIITGYTYKQNGKDPVFEDGMVIADPSTAERLLPSCDGFFFGGTDYDQYYLQDIKNTMEIIEDIAKTTDFNTQMLYYVSSW